MNSPIIVARSPVPARIHRMPPISRTSQRNQRHLRLETLEERELLTVTMTPQEQLLLELVNRARADPIAELERIMDLEEAAGREPMVTDLNQDVKEGEISVDPKQPLAPNQSLVDAMRGHLIDMLRRDYFGHDSPNGSDPSSRAKDAGYPVGAGENIAWSGTTRGIDQIDEVYLRHQGLFESVGHRINMFRDNWREIGPGVEYGIFTQDFTNYNSIMVGTLFGNRGGDHFITGVAITDGVVFNNFYDVGEGIGDLTITAVRESTQDTYTDVTGPTGSYGIQVPDGTYTITASGSNISDLTVRGVRVDGANEKIDFNIRRMPTRYIAGEVFQDRNQNGQRDGNEQGLAGRTVYLDFNDNQVLDDDELRVESDSSGVYRISDLLPGDYTVRQVLPERWEETAPFGTYVIPLAQQNLIGVDFGSDVVNENPLALSDRASVRSGESVAIPVLQNDGDVDGQIIADSVRVESLPQYGTVTKNSSNRLVYTPNPGYVGDDIFTYSVLDNDGGRSNFANVRIEVLPGKPWQNPLEAMDVNNDGHVVSGDALIIIRELNLRGPHSLSAAARQADSYYFDVSGDDFLNSNDALRIIRYLNALAADANGEPDELNTAAASAAANTDAVFAALAMTLVQDADDSSQKSGEKIG